MRVVEAPLQLGRLEARAGGGLVADVALEIHLQRAGGGLVRGRAGDLCSAWIAACSSTAARRPARRVSGGRSRCAPSAPAASSRAPRGRASRLASAGGSGSTGSGLSTCSISHLTGHVGEGLQPARGLAVAGGEERAARLGSLGRLQRRRVGRFAARGLRAAQLVRRRRLGGRPRDLRQQPAATILHSASVKSARTSSRNGDGCCGPPSSSELRKERNSASSGRETQA